MRIGVVRGHVVLNLCLPELKGTRLLLIEPITAASLADDPTAGGGKTLVAADHLAPKEGQIVGFVEGREAANPFSPGVAPVDAYCALIVENIDYHPPRGKS